MFKNAQKRAHVPGLRILISPALKHFGRVLIVTPRKSGNSPERNTIRRRIKSLFITERLYEKMLDVIVLVDKEGIATSFEKLKELLFTSLA